MPLYNFCIYKYKCIIYSMVLQNFGGMTPVSMWLPRWTLLSKVCWFSTKAIEWTNDTRYIMLKFNQKPILTYFLLLLLSKQTYQEKEQKVTTFIFE